MGSSREDSVALARAAELPFWQLLDSWSDRIKEAATLDRQTLMGLHLAVDGGYVPLAWVQKHFPAVGKQLVILRNHKAAVDRSCMEWSWDKYVAGISQKSEPGGDRARSRSRERHSVASSSLSTTGRAAFLQSPTAEQYRVAAPEVPAGLTIPWEHCGLVMPTFWSDRA
jgi:hypothetical protein